MMCAVLSLCFLVIISCIAPTHAVGGYSSYRARQFSRWGGGPPPARSMVLLKEDKNSDLNTNSLFPDFSDLSCSGKKCTANEHCCQGAVCVDTDGFGMCLKVYGIKQGEACERTADCETGLVCMDNNENDVIFRTCQRDDSKYHRKNYNEECTTSNECNVEKGLCCQVQRRHRLAPRKLCLYFTDEKLCLGPVDNAAVGLAAANFKRIIPKSLLG